MYMCGEILRAFWYYHCLIGPPYEWRTTGGESVRGRTPAAWSAMICLVFFLSLPIVARGEDGAPTEPLKRSENKAPGESVSSWEDVKGDGTYAMGYRDGRYEFNFKTKGEISFTVNGQDVKRIARDAFLVVEEEDGNINELRQLEIRAGSDGLPEYKWSINRERLPFDAEARAWFRRMLPRVIRDAPVNVRNRIGQSLSQKGVGSVLREIGRIRTDYVKSIHFRTLLDQKGLDIKDRRRVILAAGETIGSSQELAVFLDGSSHTLLEDSRLLPAFISAIKEIDSDMNRRWLLSKWVKHGGLNIEARETLLEAASAFRSDSELRHFLVQFIETYPKGESLSSNFVNAILHLRSKFEKGRVLSAMKRHFPDTEFRKIRELVTQ